MYPFRGHDKKVLAAVAAHGILNHNTAVELPDRFAARTICDLSGVGFGEVPSCLERLTAEGLLRKRNTGYNGYGGARVEGVDVWSVTPKGLMALWA